MGSRRGERRRSGVRVERYGPDRASCREEEGHGDGSGGVRGESRGGVFIGSRRRRGGGGRNERLLRRTRQGRKSRHTPTEGTRRQGHAVHLSRRRGERNVHPRRLPKGTSQVDLSSRRARRRAVFHIRPLRVHPFQHRGHGPTHGSGRRIQRHQFRLRLVLQRVRRIQIDLLLRGGKRRSSHLAVRRVQKIGRIDGVHVASSVRTPLDRIAFLHGVRTPGTSRYGPLHLRRSDQPGEADQAVRRREYQSRLYVRRRYRRRDRAGGRSSVRVRGVQFRKGERHEIERFYSFGTEIYQ
mmetsp:Transcript_3741/g.10044  ORF Transcript_3741/g.10044 Transcript_3741/m.10044 type:complete len:296 (+) Transcript_3741:417-1304(+)